MILADVHLEIDGSLTVTEGHDIAKLARVNVMVKHPVLYLLVHVDPVIPHE
jgi:divalent metal cation (Fe/Co/Zn/Cd) transporter